MFPSFHLIDSEEKLEEVIAAAKEDNHNVPLMPNYYCMKDGEISGCFTFWPGNRGVCHISIWAHSKKMSARDSLVALAIVENFCRMSGYDYIYMPCSESSPYWNYMDKFGFQQMTTPQPYFLKKI
jgi:hypothetical protein